MNRKESSFLSFLLGGLIGAVLGILYAPRSGKETREILKKAIEEYSEEGKKIYQEKTEELSEAIEIGKKSAREKLELIKEKAEKISEEVTEKVKKIGKKEDTSDVETLPEE